MSSYITRHHDRVVPAVSVMCVTEYQFNSERIMSYGMSFFSSIVLGRAAGPSDSNSGLCFLQRIWSATFRGYCLVQAKRIGGVFNFFVTYPFAMGMAAGPGMQY